jgi:hypothetical protein
MTDEELKGRIKAECEETISEKIKSLIGVVLVLLIPGWLISDTREIFRIIHNKAFPTELTPIDKEELITAYSSNIVLRESKDGEYLSGHITFYATEGQRVEYYLNVNHPLVPSEAFQRAFVMRLDRKELYPGLSIKDHKGGFRKIGVTNIPDPDLEKDVHSLGFTLIDEKDKKKLEDEVFITCIVLVYGKQ